jgi:hypothetical protein
MLAAPAVRGADMPRLAYFLIVAFTFAGVCGASVMSYSVTGMYPNGVPVSSLTQPGAAFKFDFLIPLPPTPTAGNANEFTMSVPVSYSLNGSSSACGTPGVDFMTGFSGGGLAVICSYGSDSMAVDLAGSQLFTGGVSSPTLTAGTFAIPVSAVAGISLYSNSSLTFTQLTAQASISATIPEPAAIWLTLLPLLAAVRVSMRPFTTHR